MLILCPALESNESGIKTDEHRSAEIPGGTKTAAKSTFCFDLFILTCVSNVLDMYLNNLCASRDLVNVVPY